jgi:Fe2+ transport system protein FeoA
MSSREQTQTLPLSLVNIGESVKVADTDESGTVRQRLSEMGLTPGTIVRIVQADTTGAMILALREDARLVVGRSTANKIRVYLSDERDTR